MRPLRKVETRQVVSILYIAFGGITIRVPSVDRTGKADKETGTREDHTGERRLRGNGLDPPTSRDGSVSGGGKC